MGSDDLTLRVLIEIRDEIKATRADLNARIDGLNGRVDLLEHSTTSGFEQLTTTMTNQFNDTYAVQREVVTVMRG